VVTVASKQGQKALGLAAVLGLAAGIVGYFGLNGVAVKAAASANDKFQDVVVTTGDLTYGVKLEKQMLRTVRYPKESIPGGAYSSMDSVLGQTTKVFMAAREPVTATKLSSQGGGLSMLVRPSMRAASIEVNAVSGVSGFVLPGDRVDVLVTVAPSISSSNSITKTLLQNIEVLAAGQKTQQKDAAPMTVQSVTLLVDPAGAEKLAHAGQEGDIHLVLRNPEDQEQVNVQSFSTNEMLGGAPPSPGGGVRRTITPTPVVITKQVGDGKVRIIRSAEVTETPVAPDSTSH
jgi:pilus assembly protein CpaB